MEEEFLSSPSELSSAFDLFGSVTPRIFPALPVTSLSFPLPESAHDLDLGALHRRMIRAGKRVLGSDLDTIYAMRRGETLPKIDLHLLFTV